MSEHGEWPVVRNADDMMNYLRRNDADGVLHIAQMLYGNVKIAALHPGDVVLLVSEENKGEPDVIRRLKDLGFVRLTPDQVVADKIKCPVCSGTGDYLTGIRSIDEKRGLVPCPKCFGEGHWLEENGKGKKG